MYCPKCGRENASDAKYCVGCGVPVSISGVKLAATGEIPFKGSAWGCYVHSWRNYATFAGRACRKEFWMWNIFNTVAFFGIGVGSALLGLGEEGAMGGALLFCLVALLPGLGMQIRRLHDTGRSGWWLLGMLIPVLGQLVLLLIMGFFKGEPGGNRFGVGPRMK